MPTICPISPKTPEQARVSPYTVVDSHAAVMEGEACLYEAVVAALREDDDA